MNRRCFRCVILLYCLNVYVIDCICPLCLLLILFLIQMLLAICVVCLYVLYVICHLLCYICICVCVYIYIYIYRLFLLFVISFVVFHFSEVIRDLADSYCESRIDCRRKKTWLCPQTPRGFNTWLQNIFKHVFKTYRVRKTCLTHGFKTSYVFKTYLKHGFKAYDVRRLRGAELYCYLQHFVMRLNRH